jgi:hypothetical protein
MEDLGKRLNECQRLQNTALDLTGLKIGPTDAIKVAAVLPKWCVSAVVSLGKNAVPATTGYAMWLRVLALIGATTTDHTVAVIINSFVRIDCIASLGKLIFFERQRRAE